MGKKEDLQRTAGSNVVESASKRETATPAMNGSYPAAAGDRPPVPPRSQNLPLSRIDPDPDQPRQEFDEAAIARLAESLRTRGQLQPCRVRPSETEGRYVIVCGERRWRAAQVAGLETLSCIVSKESVDPSERLADQLVENCLREDLKPIEQARAFRAVMDRSEWSGNRLAKELGIDQSSVVQSLKLLETEQPVQDMVERGELPASTAYEISKVKDPELQLEVARAAVEGNLTRTEVKEQVKAAKAQRAVPAPKPEPITVDLGDGTTVTVRWKKDNGIGPAAALKRALKLLQEREKAEQGSQNAA